jgi:DNA mismatch repair protein MutS
MTSVDADRSGYTPMMLQFLEVKDQYPHAILFYRMGDFYETFFDDAVTASRELEITLTGRDGGKGRIPMAGIPYHAAEGYIAKLIAKGMRVAICEQMEEPSKGKKLVRREVTRVITPGTLLEPGWLAAKQSTFLAAASGGPKGYGLAYADVSTGLLRLTQFTGPGAADRLAAELGRLGPAELVLPAANPRRLDPPEAADWEALVPPGAVVTWHHALQFDPEGARLRLLAQFKVVSLDGFGAGDLPLGVGAAGALLGYVAETQMTALAQFNRLEPYRLADYLVIDAHTRRNLELFQTIRDGAFAGSLLSVLDQTETAMGGRLLRHWLLHPLVDRHQIDLRLDAVDELHKSAALLSDVRQVLPRVRDVERLASRMGTQTANARDAVALGESLLAIPHLTQLLSGCGSPLLAGLAVPETLLELADGTLATLVDNPPTSITEGGLIRDGVHAELDRLRSGMTDDKAWLSEFEIAERARTGIKSLKVGFSKAFGYFIELSRANAQHAPADYERRQTLTNAERFVTPELKERETMILGAEEQAKDLEHQMFVQLRQAYAEQVALLQQLAAAVARLDVLAALAEGARRHGYVRPVIDESTDLDLTASRHPVIEQILPPGTFVPNDIRLDTAEQRLIILTGPNMAGKSTVMRQLALIVLMAQMGSFVPADRARIGLADRLFTRVGAVDDLATGQSTFMVEMAETALILNQATERSLVILDEIGRGTSTFDGVSIAWSVSEYLAATIGCRAIFATHYHELTRLSETIEGVCNYQVAVRQTAEGVHFLHQILSGGASRSYGVEVARLAGLPTSVVDRASQILAEIERRSRLSLQLKQAANIQDQYDLTQLPLFESL